MIANMKVMKIIDKIIGQVVFRSDTPWSKKERPNEIPYAIVLLTG